MVAGTVPLPASFTLKPKGDTSAPVVVLAGVKTRFGMSVLGIT